MKIAVISDIHDNLANLQKALKVISQNQTDHLICLGDVQELATWKILDNLSMPVSAVMGNGDKDMISWKKLKANLNHLQLFNSVGEIEFNNKKIIFSHYQGIIKNIITKYPNKYTLGLYGNSHQPWEEMMGKTKLLNPGNVANVFYSPTFAIVDLKNLQAQLILLNES